MDVINIDKHVLQWAKVIHKMVEEPLEGNKGQTTRMEIVYDKVKMKVVNQENPEEPDSDELDEKDKTSHSDLDEPNVVFKSTYKNNTSVPQQHQFTMKRETAATITASIKKGFSRSGHVGITLSTPDDLSNMTGGFGPEVTVRQEEDNRVHHKLSWSVNSTVNVPPGQTTVATLVIKEVEKKFNFTANVIMRGTILVRHVDLTTGAFKKVVQNDIATLLGDIKDKQNLKSCSDTSYEGLARIPDNVCIESGKVTWPVEGMLNFRFGISQDVVVAPKK